MPKDPFDLSNLYPSQPKRDSRRNFVKSQQREIFKRQKGKCAKCHKKLDFFLTEFDHIKPWELGGKTVVKNGQALCQECHTGKTQKETLKKVDTRRPRRETNSFRIPEAFNKVPKGF